ncbi:HK97 gp10 family phage protein [Paraburkholderia sp. USG1]|jgi:HK97 gp10 family phage protein|uniref:HK97-gp10 family putative phage morphogenesis protein n=1 Tax=Paraburkholderia sp. USG1 TaxID=2952268 RepID=UPI002861190F|nr:HK97-gp10 family putative phage morphogenesis protein [Paraburkholderia sp. USG1]MDR8400114.1 HK97 gp10 family phage protein [Paraburkholderia sp. USG1]
MALKLSIDNPEALTAAIDALETVASESVLRQATVAGARVIFDEVKHRAPVGDGTYERKGTQITPGFLRDNILIAYDKERSAEGLRATYLITWSKDAFYGRFLEYGHWSRPPKPDGVSWAAHRAAHQKVWVPAKPFLRPAYDAMRQAAADAFAAVIDQKVRELTSG